MTASQDEQESAILQECKAAVNLLITKNKREIKDDIDKKAENKKSRSQIDALKAGSILINEKRK